MITEPLVGTRILGTSSRLIAPNVTTWFATGNNLKFAGDMIRRALVCRLDPKCERPELREFENPDPCVVAFENRPSLVVAALTIVRAFVIAGFPRKYSPLGSFDDWSRWVRDPLIWLGRADPVAAMDNVRRDDPKLSALLALLEQWREIIGEQRITAREIIERANRQASAGFSYPDFREALLAVAGDRNKINSRRLGRWLGEVKGREVNGTLIVNAPTRAGIAQWQLRILKRP